MIGPITANFLRISAKLMRSLMGGLALFCLYYAITLSEYPQLTYICAGIW